MGYDFKCHRCGECCKRYFIITLPHELKKQAEFMGITEKEFIENNTQLFLQLFPFGQSDAKISISSVMLPKRIANLIESVHGHLPDFLIALPMLAFKRRENGACKFFDEGKSCCTIYPVRPLECILFPFISEKKAENYSRLYPFCKGLKDKDGKLSYADFSQIHFNEVSNYCKSIKEKGFSSIWKHWPNKGVLLFQEKLLGEINEKEFFETMLPYK
jgi:Fe-S-cluster containining protein